MAKKQGNTIKYCVTVMALVFAGVLGCCLTVGTEPTIHAIREIGGLVGDAASTIIGVVLMLILVVICILSC